MGSADGADSAEVLRSLKRRLGVTYPVLTANLQGLTAAIKAGATNVAVFAAASENILEKEHQQCDRGVDRWLFAGSGVGQTARRQGARLCVVCGRMPF